MTAKHIKDDQLAGPHAKDLEAGKSIPDGQPMPEDSAESEGEKHAREVERGMDHALNRIPG